MYFRVMKLCLVALIVMCASTCSQKPELPQDVVDETVKETLEIIGLTEKFLSLPKLGRPFSTPGRLPIVDKVMQHPTAMIGISRQLVELNPVNGARAAYLVDLLAELDPEVSFQSPLAISNASAIEYSSKILNARSMDDPLLQSVLNKILSEINSAQQIYQRAVGEPTMEELASVRGHLTQSIYYQGLKIDPRLLTPDAYHEMGARVNLAELATGLGRLLVTVEEILPELREIIPPTATFDWMTPNGRVRISGNGDDYHTGTYMLLIDLGGDDVYQDVGQPLESGRVSIVIDLKGNDTVRWKETPGPGSGILGINVWLDGGGNDHYIGSNMGMGVGLLGAGVLWDIAGDDQYEGGSMVEGAGQYGIGILFDEAGDDRYSTALYGQGFGGPGGVGILVDLQGNDLFSCGGLVPDQSPDRRKRHMKTHYIGMCQGYAFGLRPNVSGGVGLLLDREGEDHYQSDLFTQGGSYWFGLGMLVDRKGNDHYEAFEHCQGESLHLGAGFLGDWSGDDRYTGHEHCQGVGIDRAVGMLYEHNGDDSYQSTRQSQGAGIKPFGIGMLIEVAGHDRYESTEESQGFALKPQGFPDSQWPLGMLLDLGGKDIFIQPGNADVYKGVRLQGKQGIVVDKP